MAEEIRLEDISQEEYEDYQRKEHPTIFSDWGDTKEEAIQRLEAIKSKYDFYAEDIQKFLGNKSAKGKYSKGVEGNITLNKAKNLIQEIRHDKLNRNGADIPQENIPFSDIAKNFKLRREWNRLFKFDPEYFSKVKETYDTHRNSKYEEVHSKTLEALKNFEQERKEQKLQAKAIREREDMENQFQSRVDEEVNRRMAERTSREEELQRKLDEALNKKAIQDTEVDQKAEEKLKTSLESKRIDNEDKRNERSMANYAKIIATIGSLGTLALGGGVAGKKLLTGFEKNDTHNIVRKKKNVRSTSSKRGRG